MRRLLSFLFLIATTIPCFAQPGQLYTGFNGGAFTTVFSSSGSIGEDLVVQPDGKVVVAGLVLLNGTAQFGLIRYMPNGSLDQSFGTGGKVNTLIGSECWAYSVTLQPDGKILVGGYASLTTSDFALARYTISGQLDLSFGTGGIVTTAIGTGNDRIKDLAVTPNGKIAAVGETFNGSNYDIALLQYQSNGTMLSSTILAPGLSNDFANEVDYMPDGRMVLTGSTYNASNTSEIWVARFMSSGIAADMSFGVNGLIIAEVGPSDDFGKALAIMPDGKIIVAGSTWSGHSAFDIVVLRFQTDGQPDTDFGNEGRVITDLSGSFDDAIGIGLQSDGKIVVGGSATVNGFDDFALVRYTSNGTLDPGFGFGGISLASIGNYGDVAYGFALSGMKIYLCGLAHRFETGAPSDFALASFINDAGPLPVKLINFTAQRQQNKILLQWETEAEENISGYQVQRSHDGTSFKELDLVSAGISSLTRKKYTLIDHQPLSPVNYYRLKILESDGSFHYSKILALRQATGKLQVFPNPATSFAQLQIPSGLHGKTQLDVFTAGGAMVKSITLQASGTSMVTSLSLNDLSSGIYLIRLQNGKEVMEARMVKE